MRTLFRSGLGIRFPPDCAIRVFAVVREPRTSLLDFARTVNIMLQHPKLVRVFCRSLQKTRRRSFLRRSASVFHPSAKHTTDSKGVNDAPLHPESVFLLAHDRSVAVLFPRLGADWYLILAWQGPR